METRNVQAPNRPINPLTLVSLSTARPYDEPTPPYQNGGRPQEQEAPIAAAARYQTLIDNLPSMLYRCTLDKAGTIKNSSIAEELALPPVKIHCSILAEDAITAAVNDYRNRHSV